MDKNRKLQSYMVFLLLVVILQCQVMGSSFPEPKYISADTKQADLMHGEEDNRDSRESQKIKEALRLTQQGRPAAKSRQQQDNDMMYISPAYSRSCWAAEETAGDMSVSFCGISEDEVGERGPPYTSVI